MEYMGDMINNALLRQLERLDDLDIGSLKTKEGRDAVNAELARAQAVKDTALAMIDNQNSTIKAVMAVRQMQGSVQAPLPKMLGGCDAEG